MPVQEPFQIQAVLTSPPDDGAPQASVEAQFSGNSTKKADFKLELTGTGTHAVGFGSIGAPGAKAALIEYQATSQSLQPLLLTINGGTEPVEISPGGFFAYCNPNPAAGITSISIAHTSEATVRVRLLG